MNMFNPKSKWLLLSAIAAVPVMGLAERANAQYRNEQRGNALDGSRRVGGSGSRNDIASDYRTDTRIERQDWARQPTGNQIVTGNVTGNRQFRGGIDYRDPREFRGATGTDNSDSFISRSAGTAGASNRVTDYNQSVPFYPSGRTVNPPPGYEQQNLAGGGFVPSATVETRVDRGIGSTRAGSTFIQPGPVDLSGPSGIASSPLTGAQQFGAGNQQSLYNQPLIGQRSGVLDAATVDRMRQELRGPGEVGPGNVPAGSTSGSQTQGDVGAQQQPGAPGDPAAPGVQQQPALNSPTDNRVGASLNAQPLQSGSLTGQSTRQRLLPPAGEQTPAYADLRRKLDEFARNKNMTDEEAARAAATARKAADDTARAATASPAAPTDPQQPGNTVSPVVPGVAPLQDQPGAPKTNAEQTNAEKTNAEQLGLTDFAKQSREQLEKRKTADGQAEPTERADPPRGTAPRPVSPRPPQAGPASPDASSPREIPAPQDSPAPQAARPAPVGREPLKVDTLARGVPGKGLSELLSSAETLMKGGKFTSALQKYDAAEQVAPNNPLIKLGKANAELGASNFVRAERNLREAFNADEALLMGQYDLRAFLGEDRLRVIATDLKEIANTEPTEVRPVFLLAYIAYNSGNEQMASAYLDLAEQRSGGKDALIKKIREHWALPAAGAPQAPESAPPAEPANPRSDAPSDAPVEGPTNAAPDGPPAVPAGAAASEAERITK